MAVILNSTADINTYVQLANKGAGTRAKTNPEFFYNKQLLDTIRFDGDQYCYYRLADETPIQGNADKLQLRRWAPLQAHTVPLVEGIPPVSDRGSVEEYTIDAKQYGRAMEFTDKVNLTVVDPVIAHYTKEYSLVAIETLDLLAREALFATSNKYYADGAVNFEGLKVDSAPSMTDLRKIVLNMKKNLVKPRSNGRYHVIAGPEFYFDMIQDETVKQYMSINQTTKTMFDNSQLCPMFDMEFYETLACPVSGEFNDGADKLRVYRNNSGAYQYASIAASTYYVSAESNYVTDARTNKDASYIPGRKVWDLAAYNSASGATANPYVEFKAMHVLVVGKDALTRTGLQGEGQTKMFVKPLGSAGTLDPIDQRQSIGFKINSVGFGSCRLEAIADYICVPSQLNII